MRIHGEEWIKANPCALCGKPLNAPFGRKRQYPAYVMLQPRAASGDKAAHDFVRNRPDHLGVFVFVGICCLGRLSE